MFEVVNQLRNNTELQRYHVVLLINSVPCAQIELKTLGIICGIDFNFGMGPANSFTKDHSL